MATKTKSELVVPRMNNLIAHNKLQWYRMSDTAVIVTCPMQGDPNGCVTTQGVRCSGGGVLFLDKKPCELLVCVTTIDRYAHWGVLYALYCHDKAHFLAP